MKKLLVKSITITFIALFLFACKSNKGTTTNVSSPNKKKELTEKQHIDFTYVFFNGCKEKMLGNYEQAATNFLQCYRIDESNPAPMYELGFLYNLQGKKQQAIAFSKKAADLDPANEWYQQLYADLLQDAGQFSEAVDVYKRLVKNNPMRLDFYTQLADACTYAKKYDDALKTYDLIEEMTGVSDEVSMQKIRIYQQTGKLDKAIEEAKKVQQKFPEEVKYYGVLGELYQAKGMKDKALETYLECIKKYPDNALIRLSLADFYRINKEDDKAFNEIKIAFKNPSLDIDAKMKILLSYYTFTETHKEFKSEADELCKILVAVHPSDAKSYAIYGDFLYRDKKIMEARDQYRKALELDKSKYTIWNQVLIMDSELNDFESMLKESDEVLELFPEQPVAYLLNGAAKTQLNKANEAIVVLNKGLEYVVKNDLLLAQFYSTLGDNYNKLKDFTKSDSSYEKALQYDPKSVYVLNNYSYYLSLRKQNLSRAEEMSKKSNELETNSSSFQDTYGWILYQMGKYEEAKKWIEKSIQSGGKNAVILEHYGDVLYKLGDIEGAHHQWIEAKLKGTASEFLDRKIADKKLYE